MSNDYLWDGSGEPDPELQKLESALGRLRHNRPAPDFPPLVLPKTVARPWFLRRMFPRLALAATCAAILLVAGVMLFRAKPRSFARSEWNVTSVQGAPRLGGSAVKPSAGSGNLGVGELLETDGASRASIRADETGEIDLEPGTRLRLLKSDKGMNRVALERGTIHATIWAAPGEFVVDTPSAVAVDLGCAYTLTVDASGDGLLRTTLGWVGFRLANHEAFIPAGAVCATRRQAGPGTPYLEDASDSFRKALSALDLQDHADHKRDLQVVLGEARAQDALTLWHLLPRVPSSARAQVFDRLNQLIPAPSGVTREGILRLDQPMLDLWWNELGFGDISLWRHWERSWSDKK